MVYDYRNASPALIDAQNSPYMCGFALPRMTFSPFDKIVINSDPGPRASPNPKLRVPFYIDHSDRLILVELSRQRGEAAAGVDVFIPMHVFRPFLRAARAPRRYVEWEEWGPAGTRVLPHTAEWPTWACYVYGMRYVFPRSITASNGRRAIRVFDFHPTRLRQARATDAADDVDAWTIVTEPGYVGTSETWEVEFWKQHGVQSHLPFLVKEILLPPHVRAAVNDDVSLMLSEDTIIAIEDVSPSVRLSYLMLSRYRWAAGDRNFSPDSTPVHILAPGIASSGPTDHRRQRGYVVQCIHTLCTPGHRSR